MAGSQRVARLKRRLVTKREPSSSDKICAAGYVRVSTEGQFSDGYGADLQEASIRAFAESQGYALVDVFSDRVSGTTPPPEREGFAKLMKLAESNAFSVLLLYRFDRLARSIIHAVTGVHVLRDRFGVVVRSTTEPIDTSTTMGEMIFTVLAGMAAQERQVIIERTWGGRKEKARAGGIACGPPPFGYRRREDGSLVIEPTEAVIVREIFDLREDGRLLREIADRLNERQILTRGGTAWRKGTIAKMLDNPKYWGQVEYLFSDGTHVLRDGQHEAIVDHPRGR